MTVEMYEGSLLYLPRGVLHEARAEASEGSLHVTLTVQTSDLNWAELMMDGLYELHRQHSPLRHALPLSRVLETEWQEAGDRSWQGTAEGEMEAAEGGAGDEIWGEEEAHRELGRLVSLTAAAPDTAFELAIR